MCLSQVIHTPPNPTGVPSAPPPASVPPPREGEKRGGERGGREGGVIEVKDETTTFTTTLDEVSAYVTERFAHLDATVRAQLSDLGFPPERIEVEHFLNLRYQDTNVAMMTTTTTTKDHQHQDQDQDQDQGQHHHVVYDYLRAFEAAYLREYGFTLERRPVEIDDIRVRGVGKSPASDHRVWDEPKENHVTPGTTLRRKKQKQKLKIKN